jgi:hypothetical protein
MSKKKNEVVFYLVDSKVVKTEVVGYIGENIFIVIDGKNTQIERDGVWKTAKEAELALEKIVSATVFENKKGVKSLKFATLEAIGGLEQNARINRKNIKKTQEKVNEVINKSNERFSLNVVICITLLVTLTLSIINLF